MANLDQLTAADVAAAIAGGALSAVEVATAALDAISARDADLHAYLEVTPDLALEAARRVDERRAAGESLGPLAGWRIEPPVSEPSARVASPAATAAAEPPEEPPGTRARSQGLRVGPKAEASQELPKANSSMLVLPSGTAPAASMRLTAVAVNCEA